MKTLLLMRHAKSCWEDPQLEDIDRPLNPRGRKAAKKMGKWILKQHFNVDLILSSPSVRTQQTLKWLLKVGCFPQAKIEFRNDLYFGGKNDLIATIQSLPQEIECVFILGHNPTMELTTEWLSETIPMPTRGKIFPTASLAWLETKSWGIKENGAVLMKCIRPKLLEEQ